MKKNEELINELRRMGEELEIPRGLDPEWMQETLEEHRRKKYFRRGKLYPSLATAACLLLIAGALLRMHHQGLLLPEETPENWETSDTIIPNTSSEVFEALPEEAQDLLELPEMTYEEIYTKLSAVWQKTEADLKEICRTEEAAVSDAPAVQDLQASAQKLSEDSVSYGKTNIQVAEVDEADRIKNDGRYLYQIAAKADGETDGEDAYGSGQEQWGIQILDTEGGLKEAAFLDGFESISEFYVWNDLLITIENKYYNSGARALETQKSNVIACTDVLYEANQYHEITVYNIADRCHPIKIKTFTFQGSYETSRISDGYFYEISRFTAHPGEGKEDYSAYIPTLDGQKLSADRIYCPEQSGGSSYLVLLSVNLENPSELTDSRAVLMGSGIYYMSQKNIYMTSYESVYENPPEKEGKIADKTKLLKFSYRKGHFYTQAEGEIPGRLDSSFSLDEYQETLRAVTTVQEYNAKKITDDRTGEDLGFDYGETVQTNALYTLDKKLTIKGKIEGLAEGETIYSARFLGGTGYFVTFRQTDPLFAVDLTDPSAPKVIGELKLTGFSDYLHFYGENLLLGIGMEADEETGRQECLKLSMFDLTNPADLKEISHLNLKDYNYSEALYNHRAVLIDPEENLIGFTAEGSSKGNYWSKYLVFSYENGAFTKKMELNTASDAKHYYPTRGTFINNTLYLLRENATAAAYNRTTGALLEKYTPPQE